MPYRFGFFAITLLCLNACQLDPSLGSTIKDILRPSASPSSDSGTPNRLLVDTVQAIPDRLSLEAGKQAQLTANVIYTDQTVDNNVIWSSSDNSIATVNRTSGMVQSLKAGEVSLIATSTRNSQKKAIVQVSVKAPSQETAFVTLTPSSLSLPAQSSTFVRAEAILSDGSTSSNLSWRSSNPQVILVQGQGNSARVTAIAPGTATIHVEADADTSRFAQMSVTVTGSSTQPTPTPRPEPSSSSSPQPTPTPSTGSSTPPSPGPSMSPEPTSEPVDVSVPVMPTGLVISNLAPHTAKVSWNRAEGADTYRIYLNGAQLAENLTTLTYNLTGLNASSAYRLQISAQNQTGESAKSAELGFTTPAQTNAYGNTKIGFLTMAAMENPNGLDVKNGHAYVGFYQFVDGMFSDDNNRVWRDLNISSGQVVDRIVSEGNTATVKISGITVNGSEVWISLSEKDEDGFILYRYNTSGTRLNRYSFNLNGITTKDIAVDADTGMVYISVGLSTSSILRFDPLRYQNNPADPESVMFMFGDSPLVDPMGLDVDNNGNVFIFDSKTRKVIKFSKGGSRLLEFGPAGVDGTGPSYTAVSDVAIDPRNGEIYVTGNSSGEIMIFRYDSNGNFIHSFKDEDLTSPTKMSIDSDGKVYAIDSVKKGVLVFSAGTRP